jgi:AAA domain
MTHPPEYQYPWEKYIKGIVKADDPPTALFGKITMKSVKASSVMMKRVQWLWQEKIPLGELTIAAGREGAAKSQFTIWLAAQITRGTLPGDLHGCPRPVIICAREDSWDKTIVPRLHVAGADLDMVYRVEVIREDRGYQTEVSLTLPLDNDMLEKEITSLGVLLVILDPLVSMMSTHLNSHHAADVRRMLEPLARMAQRTSCSMVGLAHFAKTEGRDAASLISGSHAYKDVARSVLVFARDEPDSGVMSHVKSNLGRLSDQSMTYRMESRWIEVSDGSSEVPYFIPGEPTWRHVEDLLDTGQARQVSKARNFLRSSLNGSWRLSKDVEDEARQAGIPSRTLDRARQDLGIMTMKNPEDGKWWICMPQSSTP